MQTSSSSSSSAPAGSGNSSGPGRAPKRPRVDPDPAAPVSIRPAPFAGPNNANPSSTVAMMDMDECSGDFARQVLRNMRDLYPDLADVVIHVNDGHGGTTTVEAHRVVLISASETWRAMLYGQGAAGGQFVEFTQEGRRAVVRFDRDPSAHITAPALECVLDHVYGKAVRVGLDKLQAVASAAEYLALPGLKAGCEEAVVCGLTVENAVETLMEAERRELQVVRAGSLRLILDEFEAVSETRGFVEHMGLRLLVDILDKDQVRVKSESVVFEAAVRWLSAPGRERAGGEPAQRVLQRVRYPLMNSEYLVTRVSHCEETGVKGSEAALKELVSEALVFKSTRFENGEAGVQRVMEEGMLVRNTRMRPRVMYGVDPMAMECGKVVETGHTAWILCMVEVGRWVVTCSRDKTFKAWNQSTWECEATVQAHDHGVYSMTECGGLLVTGSRSSIKMGEPGSGWTCTRTLEGHTHWVQALVVDGDTLLSGSQDKTIRLWNRSMWECERTVQTEHSGSVISLAVHDGRVYSGGGPGDHTIRVWDRPTWQCVKVLRGHAGLVVQMVVWQGKLISASFDRSIKVWGLVTAEGTGGECERTLEGHTNGVVSIVVCGSKLLSGGADKSIRVWELGGGCGLARTLTGHHSGAVRALVCTRDGQGVLSCGLGTDKTIRVWTAAT